MYDILLVGKTGLGKSTTARKLLEWDSHKCDGAIKSVNLENATVMETTCVSELECGGGLKHVTREFQAWENTVTKVRVVDIPGFSDTERHCLLDVRGKNLTIAYQISKLAKSFHFRRILYFLPTRGVPERRGGSLEEELQLLYKFFGDSAFNQMIVVCTNHPDSRYQELGFNIDAARELLNYVITDITKKKSQDYGEMELLYIPLEEKEEILQKIKEICEKTRDTLKLDPAACVKCQGNDLCADKGKCHPTFCFKHESNSTNHQMSKYERLLYQFYYDSKCTVCGNQPGTNGCTNICSDTNHTTDIHIETSTWLKSIQNRIAKNKLLCIFCNRNTTHTDDKEGADIADDKQKLDEHLKASGSTCTNDEERSADTTEDKQRSGDQWSYSAATTERSGVQESFNNGSGDQHYDNQRSDDQQSYSAATTERSGDQESCHNGSGDQHYDNQKSVDQQSHPAATTDVAGAPLLHRDVTNGMLPHEQERCTLQ